MWKPSNSSHLDRLHESVEENSDTDRATQELDEPRCTEESEEADLYNSCGVDDASGHGDEVECIPGIFEIRLQGGGGLLKCSTVKIKGSYLWSEGGNLEDALHSEHSSEYEIQVRQNIRKF